LAEYTKNKKERTMSIHERKKTIQRAMLPPLIAELQHRQEYFDDIDNKDVFTILLSGHESLLARGRALERFVQQVTDSTTSDLTVRLIAVVNSQ
jgi:hypothetical protein